MDPNTIENANFLFHTIKTIPDVVWAAAIASLMTIVGVLLTNKGNNKSIRLQVESNTEREEKKREFDFKKEIYLDAIEAIASLNVNIVKASKEVIISDTIDLCIESCSKDINKIHLVGTNKLLENVVEFGFILNDEVRNLVPVIVELQQLKNNKNLIESESQSLLGYMHRLNLGMEQINREPGNTQSVFYAFKQTLDAVKADHDKVVKRLFDVEREIQDKYLKFCAMCGKSILNIQKSFVPIVVEMRSDLGFAFDQDLYTQKMESVFAEAQKYVSFDALKDLVVKDGLDSNASKD